MTVHQDSLAEYLSKSLPSGANLTHYHISSPPLPCPPLYSPPANSAAEKTYCEPHSLLVTINDSTDSGKKSEVAIFAIELQIYTTAHLTTVFVSKADSTGYLSILELPRSSGSVLQSTTSAFISWIISRRHRPDRRLVLSLFARAQNQYLFPGSVENGKKHILDDRALVKWWCKTLDPVLREYAAVEPGDQDSTPSFNEHHSAVQAKAHLVVPGHDAYETQSFFPRSFRADPPNSRRWVNSHPLREITATPGAPPRCLVPHFPDDPKSRFLSDLDEELADAPRSSQTTMSKHESPSKRGKGQWKSIKTLEQFWELMAFRQECSSGRLVGFIWIVFTPKVLPPTGSTTTQNRQGSPSPASLKRKVHDIAPGTTSPPKHPKYALPRVRRNPTARKALKGPVIPRSPRVKSSSISHTSSGSNFSRISQSTTRYYNSPPESRGSLVLPQKAYDRVHEILLRLDFSNLEVSQASTRRWIAETGITAGLGDGAGTWGKSVAGGNPTIAVGTASTSGQVGQIHGVTVLTAKKKTPGHKDFIAGASKADSTKEPVSHQPSSAGSVAAAAEGTVNMLGSGLIRKKPKPVEYASAGVTGKAPVDEASSEQASSEHVGTNILGAGLVRKKAKT